MGLSGTQIAREASSIVLTDDHFRSLISAIREGRHIYDNIRKFVLFLMQTNSFEVLFFFVCIVIGLPVPYLPIHILWINLMTDGLPALALSLEPEEQDIMSRPPRRLNEGLFDGRTLLLVCSAVVPFIIGLTLYFILLREGDPLVLIHSKLFTFSIIYQLFFVFTVRSASPLLRIGLFSNRALLGAVAIPFALQLVLLYTPVSTAFELVPLTLSELGEMTVLGSLGLLLFELAKYMPTYRVR
jgi:Ca2+-transporting ATPase